MESTINPSKGIGLLTPDGLETPPLSLGELTWRRFRRHKMAIFGGVLPGQGAEGATRPYF